MGWTLSIKETKKETKYKIWSTVTDSYITEKWMTRKEVINFLFWDKFRRFADSFLEDSIIFPHHWCRKDGRIINRGEISQKFYNFKLKSIRDENAFYKKFFEQLNEHGIKINIKDKDYQVKN